MRYTGGCHCGAVRFEVEAAEDAVARICNCSICDKAGFVHLIVPAAHFTLTSGRAAIAEYRFNTGVAVHTFCRHCGIKAFYTPRSNPNGIDVNVRCLDEAPARLRLETFDGRNWEANADRLAHLSDDIKP